jgi:protein-S-isoprenylcysteine O-methyltransferase Ste14
LDGLEAEATFGDHSISFNKLASHQLVTTGIYSWSRHPSYAGFYWWAIGTQVCFVLFSCSFGSELNKFTGNRSLSETQFAFSFSWQLFNGSSPFVSEVSTLLPFDSHQTNQPRLIVCYAYLL